VSAYEIEEGVELLSELVLPLIGLCISPLVPLHLSSALVARQADPAGCGQDLGEDHVPPSFTGHLYFAKKTGQLLVPARLQKLASRAPAGLTRSRSSKVRPTLLHCKPCP
jgi:hypothetical protein